MRSMTLLVGFIIITALIAGCGQRQAERSGAPTTSPRAALKQLPQPPKPAPSAQAAPAEPQPQQPEAGKAQMQETKPQQAEPQPQPAKPTAEPPAKPAAKPAATAQPAAEKPGSEPAPEATGLVVQGTVAAVAQTPAPGSVPYKDCLIGVWLKNAKPLSGELEGDEVLVFVWGLKDNKRTTAADWQPGTEVTLRLTPWAEAESEYGGYNRVELDDEATWTLPTYFGRL